MVDKNKITKDTVIFNRSPDTMCTIHFHGCTVTSWRVKNLEHLFVSRRATFDERSLIRGGVTLIFPRYGFWEFGPHHGFARNCRWELEEEPHFLCNGDVEAVFSLTDDDFTRSMWCYEFKMLYRITLHEFGLEFNMKIINTSKHIPFSFEFAFHSYVKMRDITSAQISGFHDCIFRDLISKLKLKPHQIVSQAQLDMHTDRIYLETQTAHEISHVAGDHKMKIGKTNLPDTIIWNPWDDKDTGMEPVIDENEYKKMLNIAPAQVTQMVRLEPGAEWEAQAAFEIVQPEQRLHLGDCSTALTKTEKIYI